MKNTIRRVRKQVRIAFRKAELENQLQALKDLNADLMQIRSYLSQFKAQQREALGTVMVQRRVPRQYTGIQDAARTLHEALMRYWHCETRTHIEHTLLLCLQAELETNNSVRLDVAICFQQSISTAQKCETPQSLRDHFILTLPTAVILLCKRPFGSKYNRVWLALPSHPPSKKRKPCAN